MPPKKDAKGGKGDAKGGKGGAKGGKSGGDDKGKQLLIELNKKSKSMF